MGLGDLREKIICKQCKNEAEVGDFLAAGIFFRYKILCMNFF